MSTTTAIGVDLEAKAAELRLSIMQMIAAAGAGHPGSSLSTVEILVSLYYRVLRHRPLDPAWADRDRFVLSKGHAAPALYAVLIDVGIIPQSEHTRLRRFGSALQGHPDPRFTPGVEVGSGSLGQAFSVAVGLAIGLRHGGRPSRVYALLGDGECQEGQVWEAAAAAAQYELDHLTAIVDANGYQHDGAVDSILGRLPLGPKWSAFGWDVHDVDGHDIGALIEALTAPSRGQPRAVVAHTVKGRGVSFMEGTAAWHSVADPARLADAVLELQGRA